VNYAGWWFSIGIYIMLGLKAVAVLQKKSEKLPTVVL
jgi:hypothetical protein